MQNRDLTVHGSDGRDTTFQVDGMTLNGIEGDGSVQSYFNEAMFEEISYQTSAISAEVSAGGVRANMIPKDGGNAFKGTLFLSGAQPEPAEQQQRRRARQGAGARRTASTRCGTSTSPKAVRSGRTSCGSSPRTATGASISTSPTASSRTATQTIDDASIRSGVVRLTTQLGVEEQGVGVSRSHPQVPRPRELRAGRLRDRRRGDRHPRARSSTTPPKRSGRARSAASCWSRPGSRSTTRATRSSRVPEAGRA